MSTENKIGKLFKPSKKSKKDDESTVSSSENGKPEKAPFVDDYTDAITIIKGYD